MGRNCFGYVAHFLVHYIHIWGVGEDGVAHGGHVAGVAGPGGYLAVTWRLPGGYLAATWRLPGGYLAVTWRLPGGYLFPQQGTGKA